MIVIDEKEYRNLQEQVGYLTEELKKLKQSLGNALPDPIPGPPGEPGTTGDTGPQGRTPKIGFGYGPLPDTGFENGDVYIARGSTNGLTKGNVYLRINSTWQLQLNLVGPQGPIGPEGDDVIANPDETYTENLEKVDIDGVIYNVLSDDDRTKLEKITLSGGLYATFTYSSVDFNGTVNFNNPVHFKNYVTMQAGQTFNFQNGSYLKLAGLGQVVNAANNPLIICENFTDAHINKRFVEGNLTTETITGVTFTYAKWSLSGSHLMIVLAGEIAPNVTTSVESWASVTLPNYIANKIVPTFGTTYIAVNNYKAYHDDWTDIRVAIAYQIVGSTLNLMQVDIDSNNEDAAHFRIQFDLLIDMAG